MTRGIATNKTDPANKHFTDKPNHKIMCLLRSIVPCNARDIRDAKNLTAIQIANNPTEDVYITGASIKPTILSKNRPIATVYNNLEEKQL